MAFKDWYDKNVDAFNANRAQRRKNDPEYAERQKQYKLTSKAKAAANRPQLIAAVNVSEACRQSCIPVWTFNRWRARGLIPALTESHGSLWLNSANIGLLVKFQKMLIGATEAQVDNHRDWLAVNWEPLEKKHGIEDPEQ
jgi:hypothetical protein